MKYSIGCLIVYLLIAPSAFAQNWELFPSDQRNVYISTEQNSNHYVYAYHADSFRVNGSDTTYFFNQKPFDSSDPYCFSHFESDYDFSLYHDPFLMDSVAVVGDHYEINIAGIPVKFFHLANLNHSWKVHASPYASSIDSVRITCTSTGQELIFGMNDSVKTFSLTAYNGNQVIPAFSSYKYKLSKSFGLTEFIPFRNLVLDNYGLQGLARLTLQRMETAGQAYGFSFPTFEDYFSHYQSGDVLLWSNTMYWFGFPPTTGALYRDSLVSVTQTTDSVCMCGYRTKREFTVGWNDTVYDVKNFSRCFIRNQFEPFLQLGTGQSTFAVNGIGTAYGQLGAWKVAEVRIDSSGIIPVFSLHARSDQNLDTLNCMVEVLIDYGADFRIDTRTGLEFYGYYGGAIDTTGLINYIPGSGVAGDCIGVNVLTLNRDDDLSIAPTLATDFIRVNSSGTEKISVSVFSLEGEFLLNQEMRTGDNLDIKFLPDGYYLIRAVVRDKVVTSKFLKCDPH